jgi:hypothetical protein
VLICVSFLLAVFLNHSAGERRAAPGAMVPLNAQSPGKGAALPATAEAQAEGGSPPCTGVTASHEAEPSAVTLIDERCTSSNP